MRFLPTPSAARRNLRGDDSFSRGMDAVITLVLFLGLGWLLDRWLGTEPLFMIGLFLLGAVGCFLGIKARYTQRMEELEDQRRARIDADRAAS
jgi:ATP synthase protein I